MHKDVKYGKRDCHLIWDTTVEFSGMIAENYSL
jgi:hypothetical protein